MTRSRGTLLPLILLYLLSGCLEESPRVRLKGAVLASGVIERGALGVEARANQAPIISGARYVSAAQNDSFVYDSFAWDPDSDRLVFSVLGKPDWTEFDEATGRLFGLPSAEDIGTYFDVLIGASDGVNTSYLAVTIEVIAASQQHTLTLAWDAPTRNEDGTPLMDLAGFRIRYGSDPNSYSHEIDIPNPGIAAYVVDGLSSGIYFFTLSAYNAHGVESEATGPAMIQL